MHEGTYTHGKGLNKVNDAPQIWQYHGVCF